jgi:hypothetical protein
MTRAVLRRKQQTAAAPSAVEHPGRAYVRRVPGQNLWVLFRFDATPVDVLTVRDAPPVPFEEGG